MHKSSNEYKNIAKNKTSYRSCIMVEEQKHLREFEKLGVKKLNRNKDGVLLVDIPASRIDDFVDLYLCLMKPGRWNEYVGHKTGFYFKMPDGQSRHIYLTSDNQRAINELLKEFVTDWDINKDLWQWLSSIDIYADWLAR